MPAPKKREKEHRYVARIDNTPQDDKAGLWDRIVSYAKKKEISVNDALNDLLHSGAARRKLP